MPAAGPSSGTTSRGGATCGWRMELVGDIAWTREVVQLQNASFAEQDDTLDELVERYRPSRTAMDQTGMGEKPVEDAQRRYGTQRVEGVGMTPAARLELAGAFKRRVKDINIRIPKSTAIRQDLHAVRRAAGPTGARRLVPPRTLMGTQTGF